MPSMPNGSAPLSEIINEEEHHTGPELKRTGRSEIVQPPSLIYCTLFYTHHPYYKLVTFSMFLDSYEA